jgi:hypothetical protein
LSSFSLFKSLGFSRTLLRQHREAIRNGFNKTTKGNRILSILLESGLLYCIAEASTALQAFYETLTRYIFPASRTCVHFYKAALQ